MEQMQTTLVSCVVRAWRPREEDGVMDPTSAHLQANKLQIGVIEANVYDQLRTCTMGERGRERIINTKEGKCHKLFEHEYNQT